MSIPITLATNFTSLDWGIVAIYLADTVAIGLYANRYIKDMADYIVAGRSLKSYPLGPSPSGRIRDQGLLRDWQAPLSRIRAWQ